MKITGENESDTENFTVQVEKFGRSEIKIIGINANPKGKDSLWETITLENNSKKKIDLSNWSVATGWENLYNHPVNKKFILKSGETKELTRKDCAFALNNKQSKIELRRPDGSVASKVKYSQKEGIQEDETYEKTQAGWEWKNAPVNIENNNAEIQSEPVNNSENIIPNIQTDQKIETENENIGKQSVLEKENNASKIVNYGLRLKPTEELDSNVEKVLGASTVKINNQKSENENYLIIFLKNIFSYGNKLVNFILNFL